MNDPLLITTFPLGQGSQGFVRGSEKVREIRDFLEKVREENFYPRNFLTSIKKSFARRNVCS